jgi:hypothetical protein
MGVKWYPPAICSKKSTIWSWNANWKCVHFLVLQLRGFSGLVPDRINNFPVLPIWAAMNWWQGFFFIFQCIYNLGIKKMYHGGQCVRLFFLLKEWIVGFPQAFWIPSALPNHQVNESQMNFWPDSPSICMYIYIFGLYPMPSPPSCKSFDFSFGPIGMDHPRLVSLTTTNKKKMQGIRR